MVKLAAAIAAAFLSLALAAPAFAHVTVQPAEAPAGSFFRFVVRVPNERDNAATTKVEVRFPEALTFVSFQDKEGWKRNVKMKELDQPTEVFGERITEAVDSVTWSGGRIEPGEFEEFGFSARVPEREGTLEFPALQTYSSGEVVRWIGPADSEEPAARVSSVDLGAGEGEGELALLSGLSDRVEELQRRVDDSGSSDAGVVLGSVGVALGAVALIVSLVRRRG